MKKYLTALMFLGSLSVGGAFAQPAVYVGSFEVDDGPAWTTNPPVYSGQQAAALLFGGVAGDYAVSTNPNTTDPGTITNTAWYDGWGEDCTEFAESYSLDVAPAGYQFPGGNDTSWSAYVSDHSCNNTNYVWRVSGAAAQIPTMSYSALMVLAGLIGWLGLRRSRVNT